MSQQRTYELGIALSGGGARGFAHAGALQAIKDAGLHPDAVAGVSAGSVIAVLYAAGVQPRRMLDLFDDPNTGFVGFTQLSLGSSGLFSAVKFRNFIMRAISPRTDFEHLMIDTYIGVSNVNDGVCAEFQSGPIADVMMASCSIPVIFRPVSINNKLYVDGGVIRNMPSWILAGRCRRLIGINVSPIPDLKKKPSLADMAMRTYELMAHSSVSHDMELCDIKVEMPELALVPTFGLKNIRPLFDIGYNATRDALKEAGLWPHGKQ